MTTILKASKKEIYKEAQRLVDAKNKAIIKKFNLITLEELEKQGKVNLLPGNMVTPVGAWAHYRHMLSSGETIMVIMQTKNGYLDIFYKYPSGNRFIYNKGSYILDDSKKMFARSHNCMVYHYHEGCSIPYRHIIDITEVQKEFKEKEINVRLALNPLSLSEYLSSDVIKTAVAGNDAFKWMVFVIIMICAMFLLNFITLLIIIFK